MPTDEGPTPMPSAPAGSVDKDTESAVDPTAEATQKASNSRVQKTTKAPKTTAAETTTKAPETDSVDTIAAAVNDVEPDVDVEVNDGGIPDYGGDPDPGNDAAADAGPVAVTESSSAVDAEGDESSSVVDAEGDETANKRPKGHRKTTAAPPEDAGKGGSAADDYGGNPELVSKSDSSAALAPKPSKGSSSSVVFVAFVMLAAFLGFLYKDKLTEYLNGGGGGTSSRYTRPATAYSRVPREGRDE